MPNNNKIIQERTQHRLALSKPKKTKFYNRDEDIKRKKRQKKNYAKKQEKKSYNRDEDIKRRKRQKENYAKKQLEKGLTVRRYKKSDEEYAIKHRKSISICRLNFNRN